ncbi:MAG: MlaD family protein [Chitinophagaceae bacterium]|nr:MlaD family protein [Chitinophagaceae bacterium]
MAFKVSNETKVGALTAITITLFILGFNFLTGKNPLKRSDYLLARFESSEGLLPANPVYMKGFQIGRVYEIAAGDDELNSVIVTISMTEGIKIPVNSVAQIKSNPLGTPAVEIVKGDARTFLQKGDTLKTMSTPGFFGSIFDKLGPTQKALDNLLTSLDAVTDKLNATLTPGMQGHVQEVVANLAKASAELTRTLQSVNGMLNKETGSLSKTANNLEAVTSNLVANKDNINAITGNLANTTQKLNELDLQKTLTELNNTLQSVKSTMAQLNSREGTMGALLYERKLYDNLNSSVNSLNLLMQDLRLHPKRYVNVSVFGKKDKSQPLMKPMREDSATQEQFKQ